MNKMTVIVPEPLPTGTYTRQMYRVSLPAAPFEIPPCDRSESKPRAVPVRADGFEIRKDDLLRRVWRRS